LFSISSFFSLALNTLFLPHSLSPSLPLSISPFFPSLGGVAEESLFHMAEWLNCPRNAGAPMGMPSGDADSNKRGGIGGGEVSAPGMFNSPIVLGGNMWKSMDPTKGLKNLGDSALKFNAGEALKNMGDSAMNFNPVDSMKQLGQSASNFGESARKFNPAKDSLDLLPKVLFSNVSHAVKFLLYN
jgi:hypothetical protein